MPAKLLYDECGYLLSPFGHIFLGLKQKKLSCLLFSPSFNENLICASPDFAPYIEWLCAYFDGSRPASTDVDIFLSGTDFQMRVWQTLMHIPYGKTISYADLALKCDFKKQAARAIGNALATNPLWIILPCHRVLHSDGSPGGYAGGLDLKMKLLAHEAKK